MAIQGCHYQFRIAMVLTSATVCFECFAHYLAYSYIVRLSFGGNRLQIKAETRLMADVESTLRMTASTGQRMTGLLSSLAVKQDLLSLLLENEQMRLEVWLYPLDQERRHMFSGGHSNKLPEVRNNVTQMTFSISEIGARHALIQQ